MANELIHNSAGTSLTQAEFEAVGLHGFNSQATGDLAYASSSSQLSRLGIGSASDILTVSGGIPAWTSTPTLAGLTMTGDIAMGENDLTGVGDITGVDSFAFNSAGAITDCASVTATANLTLSAASGSDVLIGDGSTLLYIDGGTNTLSIGDTASALRQLQSIFVFSDPSSTMYAGVFDSRWTVTSTNANVVVGVAGWTTNGSSSADDLTATVGLVGVWGQAYLSTGGSPSGTITGAAAFYAANSEALAFSLALTNQYGIYVETPTRGGTSNYGVYVAGGGTYALWTDAGTNRFDGAVVGASGAGFILSSNTCAFQEATAITTSAGNLTLSPSSTLAVTTAMTASSTITVTGAVAGATGAGFILSSSAMAFQEATVISTTAGNLTLTPTSDVVVSTDLSVAGTIKNASGDISLNATSNFDLQSDMTVPAGWVLSNGSGTIIVRPTTEFRMETSDVIQTDTNSGGTVEFGVFNQANTASSQARATIEVGGTSAGDPYILYQINGGNSWACGLDNDQSDQFVWSASSAPGTTDRMRLVFATGVLSVDGDGGGSDDPVSLFDEYDDAIVLRNWAHGDAGLISREQREENRRLLTQMGIWEPAREGWGEHAFYKLQPMMKLMAGGIYQNRAYLDQLHSEVLELRRENQLLQGQLRKVLNEPS